MILSLIRHAETIGDRAGIDLQGQVEYQLTDIGVHQAITYAQFMSKNALHDITYDAIFSSPIQAAYHTATLIQHDGKNSADISLENGLSPMDWGSLQGKKIDNLCKEEKALYEKSIIESKFKDHGGESFQEFNSRVGNQITDIIHYCIHNGYTRVGIITHQDVILAILKHYFKLNSLDIERTESFTYLQGQHPELSLYQNRLNKIDSNDSIENCESIEIAFPPEKIQKLAMDRLLVKSKDEFLDKFYILQKSIFNIIDIEDEIDDFDNMRYDEILPRSDILEIFSNNAHIIFHCRVPNFYINLIFDTYKERNELFRYIRFVVLGKVNSVEFLKALRAYIEKKERIRKFVNLSIRSLLSFLESLDLDKINLSNLPTLESSEKEKLLDPIYFHVKKAEKSKNLQIYGPAWIMYRYMDNGAVTNSFVDATVYHPKLWGYRYPKDTGLFEFDANLPEFILNFLLWLDQWNKDQKFDYR